jgi:endonuclease G, mitochondrial
VARKSRGSARIPRGLRRTKIFLIANLVLWGVIAGWYLFQPVPRQKEIGQLVGNLFHDQKQITAFDVAWDLWQLYYSREFFPAPPTADHTHIYGGVPQPAGFASGPIRVLNNTGYVVGYSDQLGNPVWAAYRLHDLEPSPALPRPREFTVDRRTTARIEPGHYTHSDYDRGHLAPNYGVATRYGRQAQEETFRMSNITPQRHGLNAGLWQSLEQKIARSYPARFGEVWVLAGPVFGPHPATLSQRVSVPEAFYMIIVDESDGRVRTQAFLLPQEPVQPGLDSYLVAIDDIERRTGLDFLTVLADDVEAALELRPAGRAW